jgi:hypothetical protein
VLHLLEQYLLSANLCHNVKHYVWPLRLF